MILEYDIHYWNSTENKWEYCMKDWDEGGLGMREVLEYINIPVE